MSPLGRFPLGAPTAPLFTDDLTAWASNGWAATGDTEISGDWGDTDQARLFVNKLGPFVPPVQSTKLSKTFTGLPANTFVRVTCNVAWNYMDFGAAGKPIGMYVNNVLFAPSTTPSGTGVANNGQCIGYGTTSVGGSLTIAFGVEGITGSADILIYFDNVVGGAPSAELADIFYDAGVLYVGGSPVSITRGGITFDEGAEWDDFDFPGKASPVEGLEEIVRTRPVLRCSVMLTGEYQFTVYRPGGGWSDGAQTGERVYTPSALRVALGAGLYLTSVIAVWPRARGDFVAVEFPRAIVRKWAMGSTDKDEGQIPIEIEARVPVGVGVTTPPFKIHTYAAATTSV